MRPGRHQRTLPARSPRRGECGGARLGPVWARMTQFPKRAPSSPTRFLQLGDAHRQAPPSILRGQNRLIDFLCRLIDDLSQDSQAGSVITSLSSQNGPRPRRPDFLEHTDPGRQDPADASPALPAAWGVLGNLWGGSLGQSGPAPKTGPALADPFLGDGRCGPAGTSEPFPRAPHGVGSAGEPVWGPFGPGWPSCQNGSRAHRPVFWNSTNPENKKQ